MPFTQTYLDVMSDVKRVFTLEELADVTGVKVRQVSNWASGSNRPRGLVRNRLLVLRSIVERLESLLEPDGIDIWLHSPNKSFGWRIPMELLAEGGFDAVIQELDNLAEAIR